LANRFGAPFAAGLAVTAVLAADAFFAAGLAVSVLAVSALALVAFTAAGFLAEDVVLAVFEAGGFGIALS
jgi:hypothetical protein